MLNCHYYDDPIYLKEALKSLLPQNTQNPSLRTAESKNIGETNQNWLSQNFWNIIIILMILIFIMFYLFNGKRRR